MLELQKESADVLSKQAAGAKLTELNESAVVVGTQKDVEDVRIKGSNTSNLERIITAEMEDGESFARTASSISKKDRQYLEAWGEFTSRDMSTDSAIQDLFKILNDDS